MILAELFTTFIYQPFFNVLILFYWILELFTQGNADMGTAVIMLAVLIRVLLLPISLMEERSEEERRMIATKAKELNQDFAHDPILLNKEMKKLLRSKPRAIFGELFSLFIQVSVSLMLWRMFASGLEGRDLHLMYPFMPEVEFPFNLVFMNRFDLAHTSLLLNFLQSLLIFILETIAVFATPYPTTRREIVRMQLILPVLSFIIFMNFPAGKKLFVITALIFSILVTTFKAIKHRVEAYRLAQEAKEAEHNATRPEEKVLVEVK
jgi:YidC/Oxa1 family membrane protein insertase